MSKHPEKCDGVVTRVVVYTDGACDPNPGTGGWAALLMVEGKPETRRVLTGGARDTTNNRMEMTAVIEGLRALTRRSSVTLVTDSEYVKNAFTKKWIEGWKKRGWKTASKEPVKNQDLWMAMIAEIEKHEVHWKWVRGHGHDPINDEVDRLAVQARLELAGKA